MTTAGQHMPAGEADTHESCMRYNHVMSACHRILSKFQTCADIVYTDTMTTLYQVVMQWLRRNWVL